MLEINTDNIPEKQLQIIVHKLLSDPAVIRKSVSGKRIQILAPGRINCFAGPDFLETAMLLNGAIIVGDAEFHRRSSEWEIHGHQNDDNYNNTILHIVLNDDLTLQHPFEVLIIDKKEIDPKMLENDDEVNPDIAETLEDLQYFALLRILRKTGETKRMLFLKDWQEVLKELVQNFLERYHSRRTRPVYHDIDLVNIAETIDNSKISDFLNTLPDIEPETIPMRMLELIKKPVAGEGSHLRREIVLNCVLPLALAIADEKARINLFFWFWSTPALFSYGQLRRKFGNIPQNYLWQQQGMLEYLKNYGSKKLHLSQEIDSYGFSQILGFYYNNSTYLTKQ